MKFTVNFSNSYPNHESPCVTKNVFNSIVTLTVPYLLEAILPSTENKAHFLDSPDIWPIPSPLHRVLIKQGVNERLFYP